MIDTDDEGHDSWQARQGRSTKGTLMETTICRHRHMDCSRDQMRELFPSLIAGFDMDQSTCSDLAFGDWLSDSEFTENIVKIGDEQSGDSDDANG